MSGNKSRTPKVFGYIEPAIAAFYERSSEEHRLALGLGPLELERNQLLIHKFLPQGPGLIADIGGGPGIYAAWLAGLGHEVCLVDPVEKHIVQAKKRSGRSKHSFQCIQGEARQLPLMDNCADLVILHGPLYHLQSEIDRIAAIREARRICKPGGTVLGFAIGFAASTLVGLLNGLLADPDFFAMCRSELTTGMHDAPESWPGLLPEAFYHRPEELDKEFRAAGLEPLATFAVEGMIWLDSKYFEHMGKPAMKSRLLQLLALTEQDPALLALSPHMMLAARKD
jgi:SAM-dependent methyltransferase